MAEPRSTGGLVRFLRAQPPFAVLWSARAVSFLGDSVGLVALILYVAQGHTSAVAVSLLMIVGDFVPQLFSPFLGTIADRRNTRALMVGCELTQAAIVAAIVLTLPGLPLLLVLVALRSTVAAVFQPASRAVVPALVGPGELSAANAAIGLGTHGFDVIGPLLAAVLLPWLTIRGLLVVDAATFVVSAALLLNLPRLTRSRTAETEAPQPFLAGVREGLRYVWGSRLIRLVAIGFCAVVLFNAVDDVALVYLARLSLHASPAWTSVLYAGVGGGLLLGFALLGRVGHRVPPAWLLLAGLVVSSLGNALTGLAWAVGAAVVAQMVRGVGVSAIDTGTDTLIQRHVPPALLGRVFGNVYGAVSVAAGLSYVVGGLVIDAVGPRTTLVVAGLGGMAVTALVGLRMRNVAVPPTQTQPRAA